MTRDGSILWYERHSGKVQNRHNDYLSRTSLGLGRHLFACILGTNIDR